MKELVVQNYGSRVVDIRAGDMYDLPRHPAVPTQEVPHIDSQNSIELERNLYLPK